MAKVIIFFNSLAIILGGDTACCDTALSLTSNGNLFLNDDIRLFLIELEKLNNCQFASIAPILLALLRYYGQITIDSTALTVRII